MPTTIITQEDLYDFKVELLEEFKDLLSKQSSGFKKKFMKTSEVMELLQISAGTLQTLRNNGTLPYSKIGSNVYFDADDILEVISKNRVQNRTI